MAKVFQPKISFHDSKTGAISSVTIDDTTLNSIESPGKVELKFDYNNLKDVDSDGNVKYVDRSDAVRELSKVVGNTAIFDVPEIIQPKYNYTDNLGEFIASPFKASVSGCVHVRTIWTLSSFDNFDDSSSSDKNVTLTKSTGDLTKANLASFPKNDIFYCKCTYVATYGGEEISLTSNIRTVYRGNTEKLSYDGIKNVVKNMDVSTGLMSLATICQKLGWIDNSSEYTRDIENRFMRFFNKIGSGKREFRLDSASSYDVSEIMLSFKLKESSTNSIVFSTNTNPTGLKIFEGSGADHSYSIHNETNEIGFVYDSLLGKTIIMSIKISFIDENFNDVFSNYDDTFKLITAPFSLFCKKSGSGIDDVMMDLKTTSKDFDIRYNIGKLSKKGPSKIYVEYEFYTLIDDYKVKPIVCRLLDSSGSNELSYDGFLNKRNLDFKVEVKGGVVNDVVFQAPNNGFYNVTISKSGPIQNLGDRHIIPFTFSLDSSSSYVSNGMINGTFKYFGMMYSQYITAVIDYTQDNNGEIINDTSELYYQIVIGEDLELDFYNMASVISKKDNSQSQTVNTELVVLSKTGDGFYDFGFVSGCGAVSVTGTGDQFLLGFAGRESMFSTEPDFVNGYCIELPYKSVVNGDNSSLEGKNNIVLLNKGCSSIPPGLSSVPGDSNGRKIYYGYPEIMIDPYCPQIKKSESLNKFYLSSFELIKDDHYRVPTAMKEIAARGYLEIGVDHYIKMTVFGQSDIIASGYSGVNVNDQIISTFVSGDDKINAQFEIYNKCKRCNGYHQMIGTTFNIVGDKKYNDTIYKHDYYPNEYTTNGNLSQKISPSCVDGQYVGSYKLFGDGIKSTVRSLPANSGVGIESNDVGEKILSMIRTLPISKNSSLSVKNASWDSSGSTWTDENLFVGDYTVDLKILIYDQEVIRDEYVFEFIVKDDNQWPFKLDFNPVRSILGVGHVYDVFGASGGSLPSFIVGLDDFKNMVLGDNTCDTATFVGNVTGWSYWTQDRGSGRGTFTQNSSLTTSISVTGNNTMSLTNVNISSQTDSSQYKYGCYDIVRSAKSNGGSSWGIDCGYIGGCFVFNYNNIFNINNLTTLNVKYPTLSVYNPSSSITVRGYTPYLSPHVINSGKTRNINISKKGYDSYNSSGIVGGSSGSRENMRGFFHYIIVRGIGDVSLSTQASFEAGVGTSNPMSIPKYKDHTGYFNGSNSYYENVFTRVPKLLNTNFSVPITEESINHAGRFACSIGDFINFFYNGCNNSTPNIMFKVDSLPNNGVTYKIFDMADMKPVNKVEFKLEIKSGDRLVSITSYSSTGDVVEVIKLPFNSENRFFGIFKIYANRGGALNFINSYFSELVYYDNGKDISYDVSSSRQTIIGSVPTFTPMRNVDGEIIGTIDFKEPSFCWIGAILYPGNYTGAMFPLYAGIRTSLISPQYPGAYMWYESLSLKRRSGSYTSIDLSNTILDFIKHKLGYLLRHGLESMPICKMNIGDFYKLIKGRSGSSSEVSNFIKDEVISRSSEFYQTYTSEYGSYREYNPNDTNSTTIECCVDGSTYNIDFDTGYSNTVSGQAIDASSICTTSSGLAFLLFRSTTDGSIDAGWVVIPSSKGKDGVVLSTLTSIFPSIKIFKSGEVFNVYKGPKNSETGLSGLQTSKRYYIDIYGLNPMLNN